MSDRFLPLEGVRNFRDFGGYEAPGLGRVRRGRLYRSGHFAEATEADQATLDGLGCTFLVDLRRPEERARQPNLWPGAAVRTHAADGEGDSVEPPHIAFLRTGDLSVEGVDRFMLQTYRALPFAPEHERLFSHFFNGLLEGGGAGVVHCAAGKDRTGFLCALTLTTLGVPEDDVLADYDLTNHIPELQARLPMLQAALENHFGRPVPLEALRPFVGVRAHWLHAALEAVAEAHGGLDGYLEHRLGVGAAERERLRTLLLE